MILIPSPKHIEQREGQFIICHNTQIAMLDGVSYKDAKFLKNSLPADLKITKLLEKPKGKFIFLQLSGEKKESYKLEIKTDSIVISGGDSAGIFYGIQTLIQITKNYGTALPCMVIEDSPQFSVRGYLQDITRGKIPKLETLKKLADMLAHYKCNHMQLYIEHSFAFRGQTQLWLDADPITAEEILELDEYCKDRYIELVPCMATFGHLEAPLRARPEFCELSTVGYDVDFSFNDRIYHHTLNISNEKSYEFICNAIDEFLPLFSSDKFNVCGDETHDLCKDKSKHLLKENDLATLYSQFIGKIIAHVESRGKRAMMWGDIIGKYPDKLGYIPDNTIFLNWMYGEKPDEKQTILFANSGKTQFVCGTTHGYSRLVNETHISFENIYNLYLQGKKYDASGAIITDWGDLGHMNLTGNSAIATIYGISMAWNTVEGFDPQKICFDISILEFENQDFAQIMYDIGRNTKIQWANIVNWYEWNYVEKRIIDDKDAEFMDNFLSWDISEVQNSYKYLKEKYIELLKLNLKNKTIYDQALIGTEGNILLQEFYLDIRGVTHSDCLSERMEIWFDKYSKIWRNLNHESELFRIRNVIKCVCEYLRNK